MNKRDLSISMKAATVKSLALAAPIAIVQAFVFFYLHKLPELPENGDMLWFAFLLLAGIFIHELIHMFAWALFARKLLSAF